MSIIFDYFLGLQVLVDENLAENSAARGASLRQRFSEIQSPRIMTIRGKGLMNAMVIKDVGDGVTAMDVCMRLRDNGLLAKPTHGDIIRCSLYLSVSLARSPCRHLRLFFPHNITTDAFLVL